jgi:hypothetical protein
VEGVHRAVEEGVSTVSRDAVVRRVESGVEALEKTYARPAEEVPWLGVVGGRRGGIATEEDGHALESRIRIESEAWGAGAGNAPAVISGTRDRASSLVLCERVGKSQ